MKDNFLRSYMIDDLLCERIVKWFEEEAEHKGPGTVVSREGEGVLDTTQKESTDTLLTGDLYNEYATALQTCLDRYLLEFEMANETVSFSILEGINIQHYPPGGGYKKWHFERANGGTFQSRRHLVFMTYLNNVYPLDTYDRDHPDNPGFKGGTHWYYQKLRIQPRAGATVIWPADWTYTHKGIIAPDAHKYIATGWFSFDDGL